jgi:acetyl esterase
MYRYDADLLPYIDAFPAADLADLAETRRRIDEAIADRQTSIGWSGVALECRHIEAPGLEPVPVAIYRPADASGTLPTMVYFHGGGFVLADERSEDPLLTRLVREAGIAVVSVGYRLAPEHPCPAALDDGRAVLSWCFEHACELGFDADRLALGGRSAGAALAAGVALAVGADSGAPIAFLYLGEPVLDGRLATPSMLAMDDTPVWRRRDAELSWQLYLGGRSLDELPPYASPATCEQIAHLPPTFVTANEIDPLRDEAIEFVRRLLEAGVAVEFHLYRGAFHGAMSFDSPLAERAQADLVGAVGRSLTERRQRA